MKTMSMKKTAGFTLIELIVVIVLLGILAGIAIPRYIDQTVNAKKAALNGLAGALNSAVALAKAQYRVDSTTTTNPTAVTMDGSSIAVTSTNGIPTSAGIQNAVTLNGFTVSSDTTNATFNLSGSTSTTCNVVYSGATGSVTVNTNC